MMNNNSGIRDNYSRGKAGEELAASIRDGSSLSFVSAYFTIHAYGALRGALELGNQARSSSIISRSSTYSAIFSRARNEIHSNTRIAP